MTTHELAQLLLKHPDQKFIASVDISTGEDDYDARVFGAPFGEVMFTDNGSPAVILFYSEGE